VEDYYELLGVSPHASKREIARAYRRRTVARHRNRVIQLEDQLKAMQQAYETLSDPERRREYDERRDQERAPARLAESELWRREGRLRAA